jgi:hypothetical protein
MLPVPAPGGSHPLWLQKGAWLNSGHRGNIWGLASRAPRKKINQRPEPVRKYNRQRPGDFFVAGDIFILDAVNQHPNPENEYSDTKQKHKHPRAKGEQAEQGGNQRHQKYKQ